ncbi:type I restriction enzyme S subunit [Dokdonella fugitiva]|uniref:Type I restriction enzyme S subunit n=1 Tax=Dokdonella fugitiva TaxID=328517 RepID=A0A839F9R8_9GAMM|nr:restriction endonuclease subunit S [Dokdonella fugitiva]MBA8889820.1 type I restriction enzyme S subunit [Dokdonella fugitiva]
MSVPTVRLGELIELSGREKVGARDIPIMSITMRDGLIDQAERFKKRIASSEISGYKYVAFNELVVGFPIDEGVLGFQRRYPGAAVSPAYDVWRILDPDRVDISYLERYLRSPQAISAYQARMRGAVSRRRVLTKDDFREIQVPMPPVQGQRHIAAILDSADALRAKRREVIAKLDELLQSVFVEMFGDPARNPKGWPQKPLSELAKVQTGGTPPSSAAGVFDGPIPFVTPGDLGGVVAESRRTVTSDGALLSRIAAAGSTLVCCIGATIGKMGLVTRESAFNQQINSVTWHDQVDPVYGYHAMRFLGDEIAHQGASTTLPILNKGKFEKLAIMAPAKGDQEAFGRMAAAIARQCNASARQEAQLEQLFLSLQQKFFISEGQSCAAN